LGLHAARRGELKRKDIAIVIGCGPVGLATICILKARGIRTIIASDFSPGRRALARNCGADVVIDPADGSPYANFGHSPLEYRDTVHLIAEGKVNCVPMITGTAGLDGVAGAFEALRDPERHAKILVDPAAR
jgi:threonine dehydrogenase-like Zn-dependent dehydrogenase